MAETFRVYVWFARGPDDCSLAAERELMGAHVDERAIPGLLLGDLSSVDDLVAAVVALPDPIFIMRPVRNPEGELTELIYEYVNPAVATLYQMPAESIVGHGNLELLPSAADPSIWGNYIAALDTGKPVSFGCGSS
jgi:PAS domain-containing protein